MNDAMIEPAITPRNAPTTVPDQGLEPAAPQVLVSQVCSTGAASRFVLPSTRHPRKPPAKPPMIMNKTDITLTSSLQGIPVPAAGK